MSHSQRLSLSLSCNFIFCVLGIEEQISSCCVCGWQGVGVNSIITANRRMKPRMVMTKRTDSESDLTWLGLSHQLVFLCFCLVASEGSKELRHRHIH